MALKGSDCHAKLRSVRPRPGAISEQIAVQATEYLKVVLLQSPGSVTDIIRYPALE